LSDRNGHSKPAFRGGSIGRRETSAAPPPANEPEQPKEKPVRRQRTGSGLPPPHLIDRLPPHSIEAEQVVLGSILLDAKVALPEAAAILGDATESFYDLRHQTIYEACCAVFERGHAVDLVMVAEELKRGDRLEPCGGVTYIAALVDVSPSGWACAQYAEIVAKKAELRRVLAACTASINNIYEREEDDETLASAAEAAVLSARRRCTGKDLAMPELVHKAIDEIEQAFARKGQISGVSTGFVDLDRYSDGLHPDELIVLSGASGFGKTSLVMNIVEHVAVEQGLPVACFSFEMSPAKLTRRLLTSRARVNMRNIQQGFLSERDFPKLTGAAGKLVKAPIHLVNASGMTVFQVRAKGRQLKAAHGVRLVVVDYMQLVSESGKKGTNREQEMANISANLKRMATELEVTVVALSQLNEDGKTRESRAIEFDADGWWDLFPEADPEDPQHRDALPVGLKLRKQRDGERNCVVHLTFLPGYTRFESAARTQDLPA
jgi:replicative DNA helicase